MTGVIGKELVLKAFIEKFESELSAIARSAKTAYEAATHEETKAEDRHDTFALEASYLAAGQATRIAELERTLLELQSYLQMPRVDSIVPGTYVVYESEGVDSHALFTILGGGTKIDLHSIPVQVISMNSPLGEAFLEGRVAEIVNYENRGIEKIYKIISIK